MNYRGSCRRLIDNSTSAMLAAIEVYNKPRFSYRDEVVVVLIVNAWELLLKAIVSKSGRSIYYRKRRHEPYRTLALSDACSKATESDIWPDQVDRVSVQLNLDLLVLYRNNVVHFYNEQDFGTVLYSLMQTAIHNFRDLACAVFNKDIANEISWQILPLGTRPPVDPVEYLKGANGVGEVRRGRAVQDFLVELKRAEDEVREVGADSDRLLTLFTVNLQSVKKMSAADIVVGVSGGDDTDAIIVQKKVDPNVTHPYRMKDVLAKVKPELQIGSYTFFAITQVRGLRDDPRYCWKDADISLVRWSTDVVSIINRMSSSDVRTIMQQHSQKARNGRGGMES